MEKPLISAIIPVYNRIFLLKEAVLSVINQIFKNYELIIVDDCSWQDTEKAVLELPGIENINLKYIKLKKHSGMPGFVRNRGVSEACGVYIAFLDSDDLWLPDKLQKQLNSFDYTNNNNKNIICHTREKWLRNNKIISQASQRHKRSGNIF